MRAFRRWWHCFWRGHRWTYSPGAESVDDDAYGYYFLGYTYCSQCGRAKRQRG